MREQHASRDSPLLGSNDERPVDRLDFSTSRLLDLARAEDIGGGDITRH